jgi:hypothetical protein
MAVALHITLEQLYRPAHALLNEASGLEKAARTGY